MSQVGAIVVLLAATAFGCRAQEVAPVGAIDGSVPTQLPRGVRPLHYDVRLDPQPATKRFTGRAEITLALAAATDRLTLNALELRFLAVRLRALPGGRSVAPRRIEVDAATQTASFVFARRLQPGRYALRIDYAGVVADQAAGLFAIDYGAASGPARALFTQFESSHARRVVPSWDEPAFKATFSLETRIAAGQMAVSNMPAERVTTSRDGSRRVRFATTPPMPTYLLFVAIGDFERATANVGATELGVVTRRGVVGQARFALASAQAVLAEYNDYFAIPYPLPKLDNVAAPGGSQTFGAMENWGAIFTFEQLLLLDPETSAEADRRRIFGILAHEMAHQWFGDLVTMRWWDDLWLNEGFASWMAARATRKLHPEWNSELASVGARNAAMALDSFRTAHPVVQPIETVEQASQAFDDITYLKGAAVIRMIEAHVGADAWRDGVRRYLKAHAYGSTSSDDLWREIQAVADSPVLAIAHQFTRQPGVPLVVVTSSTCEAGQTSLELEPDEFRMDGPATGARRWSIPVIARIPGGNATRTIVDGAPAHLVVPGCGAVIVNAGQTGYYRTRYPEAQKLAIRAAFARLDPIDQLGLLDDTWALGLAGRDPVTDALELVSRTAVDAEPMVWYGIAEQLRDFDPYYDADPARQATWRAYAIARLAPVLARVGWDARPEQGPAVEVLRGRLIRTLGVLGDRATIDEARRRYDARDREPAAYPVALRQPILDVVAHQADPGTWEALHVAARSENGPTAKGRLYRLLSGTRDEALARRALELALGGEPSATDGAMIVREVAQTHPDLAFDFALAHQERVDALLDPPARLLFYAALAERSLDPAMVTKLQAYAEARLPPSARRPAEAAMAQVRQRAAFVAERRSQVDAWLQRQLPP